MNFEKLADKRIEAAIEDGQLNNLAGSGSPLKQMLKGDPFITFGYGLMAKAGALPTEILLKIEIANIKCRLAQTNDPQLRRVQMQQLADCEMRFAMAMEGRKKS